MRDGNAPPRTTIRWYRVYLSLTAVAVVLLVMEWLRIPPVAALPMVVVTSITVGAFVVVSILHWFDVYRWRRRTDEAPPEFETTLDEDLVRRRPESRADEENEPENERDDPVE